MGNSVATISDSRPLSDKIAKLRAAAEKAGAKVIAPLVIEPDKGGGVVSALIDEEQMLALIDHLKPRVVFIVEVAFDALTELVMEIGDEDLDIEELERDKRVKPLLKRWRERDGETARVVVSMYIDGVLYTLMEQASWLEAFESEAEEVADELLDD
jgi:hypothetical protein